MMLGNANNRTTVHAHMSKKDSTTMTTNTNTKSVNTTNTTKSAPKSYPTNLPLSVVIVRKNRKVYSDDIASAALILKYGSEAGLRGNEIEVASNLAKGVEAAGQLALEGKFLEAAKRAASCGYVFKHNPKVASLKIGCRDGNERKVQQVVGRFSETFFRIAEELRIALDTEAKEAAAKAAKRAEVQAKVTKILADAEAEAKAKAARAA